MYAFTVLVLFCFVVADCQDFLVDVDNAERREARKCSRGIALYKSYCYFYFIIVIYILLFYYCYFNCCSCCLSTAQAMGCIHDCNLVFASTWGH